MRLAIVSHKLCWKSETSQSGFVTDGGFPLQIAAISELFDETRVVVPCADYQGENGVLPLVGKKLEVVCLTLPKGEGLRRKLDFPLWLIRNGRNIWKEIRRADAVHAAIPGDVGTIGMLFALLLRKPLFVRHCGNWFVQRTVAENFWKWAMEYFAGGRNVMFATGGAAEPPSAKNKQVKWIFSTSLNEESLERTISRNFPTDGNLRLITVCRLEARKGVDLVIESMPKILKKFSKVRLEIVGGGSLEESLKEKAKDLGLGDLVTFHGKVEQTRVISLMSNADVFCFPTSASEGFPKVVIEALSCGLPVITTNVSVLPTLIGNRCGVVLEKPTSENLAFAITKIFADEKDFHKLSRNAVETARGYSLEKWGDFIKVNLQQAWNEQSLSSDC